jgi:2,5-diamino-6-(ribosylamino)-4(3H)-pyrimidinone 5'-phosphate reductase
MVGGKTLLDEDPKLTVKSEVLRAERVARGLSPNPVKVGIVTKANIKLDSAFLDAGPAEVVIFTTYQTSKRRLSALRAHGAKVYIDDSQRVDLPNALTILHKLGIQRLMVEGGATLNFELLRLGLVDEVSVYIAPMVFGGETAPTMAAGSGLKRNEAIPLKLVHAQQWDDGGVLLKYFLERST